MPLWWFHRVFSHLSCSTSSFLPIKIWITKFLLLVVCISSRLHELPMLTRKLTEIPSENSGSEQFYPSSSIAWGGYLGQVLLCRQNRPWQGPYLCIMLEVPPGSHPPQERWVWKQSTQGIQHFPLKRRGSGGLKTDGLRELWIQQWKRQMVLVNLFWSMERHLLTCVY